MNLMQETIRRVANHFGYEISRIPRIKTPLLAQEHEGVHPFATYSPWKKDPFFLSTFAAIRGLTLVDKYRCYELWMLIEQVKKLDHGHIIEIGVWRGGTGALLATQAKHCGINEQVYLCDTFQGVVKAGPNDSAYHNGEHAETSRQLVEGLIFDQLHLDNVEILEGIFPDQTGHKVADKQFRFCHVDVDVYQSAKDIVDWIWPRMVPGGLMVYDDYGFYGCDGITKCVTEQMQQKDRLVIHNLNGHAVVMKL